MTTTRKFATRTFATAVGTLVLAGGLGGFAVVAFSSAAPQHHAQLARLTVASTPTPAPVTAPAVTPAPVAPAALVATPAPAPVATPQVTVPAAPCSPAGTPGITCPGSTYHDLNPSKASQFPHENR